HTIGDKLLTGYDWRNKLAVRGQKTFINTVLGAVEHLRSPNTPGNQVEPDAESLAEWFRKASAKLARLYAVCAGNEDIDSYRNDIAFFEEVRVWMAKWDAE